MKFKYNKLDEIYQADSWTIEGIGGFITSRHWWVHNDKLDIHFWQSTKREAIQLIEQITVKPETYTNLARLYKQSLY